MITKRQVNIMSTVFRLAALVLLVIFLVVK